MSDHPDRPWWADLVPDIRAWATAGMFGLIFYLLFLISTHKELASNELFKTVATLLVGSGAFGLVCSFLWGGSKTTAAASETVNAMARASTVPTPPTPAAPPPSGPAEASE